MIRWIARLFLVFLVTGQPLDTFSMEVSDSQVKDVAKELACLCGTCPRRPLDECTCGTADNNRARIKSELESGKTKEVIIAGFIRDFGKQTLSQPPAEGFNLAAWIMPVVVLLFGGVIVRTVLHRWSEAPSPKVQQVEPEAAETDPYLAKLEQELKDRNT